MNASPIKKMELYWLAAILLLAVVLRIYGLNGPLWYDEIQTVETHLRLPWQDMMQSYSMNHHYFFNLQSKLSIAAFGEVAWAIRFPALIFGVGSIAAMWVLARNVADTSIAHVTALLLALSYHHIWFSQNARGYTELAFWSTLGTILFLRGLAAPSTKIWVGYGLVAALAIFTHLTGAFLFAAHGLVWIGLIATKAYRGQLTRPYVVLPMVGYLVAGISVLIFYAPILSSLVSVVGSVSETSAVDVMTEYQNPIWTIYEGVSTAIGSAGPLVAIVAAFVIGVAVIGGKVSHRSEPLFGLIVIVHIALTLVLLTGLGMRVWPRFFFSDIGFLMLLIVLGVRQICSWISTKVPNILRNTQFFSLAVVAMLVLSVALASRNYMNPKQNLIGAVKFVSDERQTNERVIGIGYAGGVFVDHFGMDWEIVMNPQEYNAAMSQAGSVIVVVAFPGRSFRAIPQMDIDSEIDLKLLKNLPGTLGDGAVLVFRRN